MPGSERHDILELSSLASDADSLSAGHSTLSRVLPAVVAEVPIPPEQVWPPRRRDCPLRWVILFLGVAAILGPYEAFDGPAATQAALRVHFGSPAEIYPNATSADRDAYAAFSVRYELLYTLYSFPNIVLPVLGGLAIDRLGLRKMLIFSSAVALAGQVLVVIGVWAARWDVLMTGRAIFGAGTETLCVAQRLLIARWFIGGQLALAMGVVLAFGRFGSVICDLVSAPFGAADVTGAYGVGALACIVSLAATCAAVWLDTAYGDKSPLDAEDRDDDSTERSSIDDRTVTAQEAKGFVAKPRVADTAHSLHSVDPIHRNRRAATRDDDMFACLLHTRRFSGPMSVKDDGIELTSEPKKTDHGLAVPDRAEQQQQSPARRHRVGLGSDEATDPAANSSVKVLTLVHRSANGYAGEVEGVDNAAVTVAPPAMSVLSSIAEFVHVACAGVLRDLRSFSALYWLHVPICCVGFPVVTTFNSVASAMLTARFEAAGVEASTSHVNAVMTILYSVSAALAICVGALIDRLQRRPLFMAGALLLLAAAHASFIWTTAPAEVLLALIGLGFSLYAAAFWPSLTSFAPTSAFGSAYGLMGGVQNAALALAPLVVAVLQPPACTGSYSCVSYFFSSLGVTGFVLCVVLYVLESRSAPSHRNRRESRISSSGRRGEQDAEDNAEDTDALLSVYAERVHPDVNTAAAQRSSAA